MIFKTRDLGASLFENQEEAFVVIAKLFSRKWFERIWIVQEVASGKIIHVMYNGTCLDWDVLTGAAQRLGADLLLRERLIYYNSPNVSSTDMSDPKLGRSATINMVEQMHWPNLETLEYIRVSVQRGKIFPLALLLVTTTSCQAKNPRGKVFALLGICKDGCQLPFKPNYKDKVEDVLLKTTTFLLSSPEDWFYILTVAGCGLASESPNDTTLPVLDNYLHGCQTTILTACTRRRPNTRRRQNTKA